MSNTVHLTGRIGSDIGTFGNGNNGGCYFRFVTSKTKLVDNKPVKDANGYNETYDQWHNIKVFGGLAKAVANHKKKGERLYIRGELRYSTYEKGGDTHEKAEIVADEVEFL
ncbi:single-strand binding protein [Sphingomonas sp. SKA58]|uniref:single-stranded DNA-binding protein n=1 Tax=Sphingomonas sp. (strain SKA58) TaxID=314266 RepID=UPI0000D7A6F3|nr:single-stranded DNA-binding protein [Sphingomonas sp. SKA58]EAT07475.1 single-strand binding protein [Sphingomonas sp. SKA58]